MQSHFLPQEYPPAVAVDLDSQRLANPAFSRWVEQNVTAHRVPGYAAVTLSTKLTGVPPGDVSDAQMDAVAGYNVMNEPNELVFVGPAVALEDLGDPGNAQEGRLVGHCL